ncbi:NUDIX domain-containing protein [Brucella sp. IR073]|uniref:NUDIX domain-containing protein n=1 Tax=unclassified Brucella TaxID=2632610 RepID=UPI003B984BB6
MSIQNRIRIRDVTTLSDDWYLLKKTTFDWQRSDGSWQTMSRETYDRGNGATLLPYDPVRGTVLLTRQFRYPAYVNGHDDLLIEAAAGLLDEASPEERIRKEVEEELGLVLGETRQIFSCFMSPGSVTERLHFFVAEYDPTMRKGDGGGIAGEGEDIEVLELKIDEALAMIESGAIQDAKTIMLLQYAALNLMPPRR